MIWLHGRPGGSEVADKAGQHWSATIGAGAGPGHEAGELPIYAQARLRQIELCEISDVNREIQIQSWLFMSTSRPMAPSGIDDLGIVWWTDTM
jgi:hypothetical protein